MKTLSDAEKSDAKRWLIIGAHQAGATDKQIAKLCGVPQPTVRRFILNFKTTGSPCIPKGLTKKERSRPIVEYDEDGKLIDSDDEQMESVSPLRQKIKARRPSAKDLIAYVLSKAQQEEKKQALFVKHEEDEDKWRPPTPPRDHSHQQQVQALTMKKPPHARSTLSPPLSESSVPSTQKYMKGFEAWTMEEDKILMAHVLTRLSGCRWNEAELKLRGRHKAKECEKRWEILRNLLIRGAEKSGTRGW